MTEDRDGVALFSASHPRSRWSFWTNLWWKFFPPRLHADALETVELDISEARRSTAKGLLNGPSSVNENTEDVRRRLNDGDGA